MKIRNIINSTIALFMVLTFASCDALDLKPISFITVSYTHLDVYKRQVLGGVGAGKNILFPGCGVQLRLRLPCKVYS